MTDKNLTPRQALLLAIPLRYKNPPDLFAFTCHAMAACIREIAEKEVPTNQFWLQYGFSVLLNSMAKKRKRNAPKIGQNSQSIMGEGFASLSFAIDAWREFHAKQYAFSDEIEFHVPFFRAYTDYVTEPYSESRHGVEGMVFQYCDEFNYEAFEALADSINIGDIEMPRPTECVKRLAASMPNVISPFDFDTLESFALEHFDPSLASEQQNQPQGGQPISPCTIKRHPPVVSREITSQPPETIEEILTSMSDQEIERRHNLWLEIRESLNATGLVIPIEEWPFPKDWQSENVAFIYDHLHALINSSLKAFTNKWEIHIRGSWEDLLAPIMTLDLGNVTFKAMEDFDDPICATATLRNGTKVNISRVNDNSCFTYPPRDACVGLIERYIHVGIQLSAAIKSDSWRLWRKAEAIFRDIGFAVAPSDTRKQYEMLGKQLLEAKSDLVLDTESFNPESEIVKPSSSVSSDDLMKIINAATEPIKQTQVQHGITLAKIDAQTTRVDNRLKKKLCRTKAKLTEKQQDGIYMQWMAAQKSSAVKELCEHKITYEAAYIQYKKHFSALGANSADDVRRAIRARSERLNRKK